ncbi:putative quinol monooxygenase [Tropicimonas sp. S265A]|uniref:putative quinol monooxygenase n=1 Tax=Tropicimonas sp. S265A TaxID=3415134 RepID=UPI003C7B6DC8
MGVRLAGTLKCDGEDAEIVRKALPEHIRLSRAETGCVSLDVTETAPDVFEVAEHFTNAAAVKSHQSRTRASRWWDLTRHIPRDITVQKED